MVKIELTENQKSKLEKGGSVQISSEDLDFDIQLQRVKDTEIDVKPVEKVEISESTDTNKTQSTISQSDARKKIKDLKKEIVDVKTEKKKLQKRQSKLQEEVDEYNEKIRLASNEDRPDLVDKIKNRKKDKLEQIESVNNQLTDLREQEHNIMSRIDDLEEQI